MKGVYGTAGRDEGRRGQNADAWDLLQAAARDGMVAGHARELLIDCGDACLERSHLVEQAADRVAHQVGPGEVGVLEHRGDAREGHAGAAADRQAVFA